MGVGLVQASSSMGHVFEVAQLGCQSRAQHIAMMLMCRMHGSGCEGVSPK